MKDGRPVASNATISIDAGQRLTIGSGGILAPGTAGGAIVGSGSLTAGSGTGSADLIAIVPDAANTLTSPFAGVTSDTSSEWTIHTVKLLLTLAIYGFGLGFLARVLRVGA